jgi:TolB-like protein
MTLFAELKRRNVLRVAAAYVAVSWLLIQVVETLFPVFGLSDAAIRAVVIMLAIGFLPAMIVAWAFELTPEGFVRDSEVDRSSAAARASSRRLDRIVMVALALAVGYFAFDKFMLDPERDAALAEAAKEEGRVEATQARRYSGRPVLAVLPFTAVTATADSAFFAAGVHDDLLTKLAQTRSLLVISRTSVMEYKDVQRNMREIGEALGADAILEGGVQSAGDRIRINVQLIDAKTDEHLWAETYDRELTTASIFDVQDDIARAIAKALQGTFATAATNSPIPTENMAAYRAYHEALILLDKQIWQTDEYRALLHKASELDPGFTRPLALLVGSYAYAAFRSGDPEHVAKADATLEEIRAAAPGSVDYLVAQTYYTYYIIKDYALAHDLASRVLEIAPSDTDAMEIKAWIERRQGHFEALVESMRQGRQLEPGNPWWTRNLIVSLSLSHRYDEALAEISAFEDRDDGVAFLTALLRLREHGDLQRMVAEIAAAHDEFGSVSSLYSSSWAYLAGGDFTAAEAAVAGLPDGGPMEAGLTEKQTFQLLIAHFLGQRDKVAEIKAIARENIDRLGIPDDEIVESPALTLALMAAIDGDAAKTEQFIRQYYRGAGTDWTNRAWKRDDTCELLGLAGAAEAAVQCLRDGLEEPSQVLPFLEPKLPYYDPIRDEPVFIELVEELENQA